MVKRNWFETLNEALESENLLDSWDVTFAGISYGETKSYYWNDRFISIYRENDGRYERPVHYSTIYNKPKKGEK